MVATALDTCLKQLELAYNKHHEGISIMGEGLTQCQRDIQNLGKSFGTLEIQQRNLAQGLEALREELPKEIERMSQPMYTGIVRQVQQICKRESDVHFDHFQALLGENEKAIQGVGATVQRCESKIESVADVAHQARNLAQKVDGVTHQVGAY